MAFIFDIKRYAIHDGPGIRTTIFVKGCPLRCVWCHNPESWDARPQRLYKKQKCIGCKECVEACPEGALTMTSDGIVASGRSCVVCGKCAEGCPSLAMEICGKDWAIHDLLNEIERERGVMCQGGGGVTISGGEPLMHPGFTLPMLKALGERGYHRAVDTTLFAPETTLRKVADECELFLVDIKSMDPEIHRRFTGVSNQTILSNLRTLSSLDKAYYIRIPLISGVNASEVNITATADFLDSLHRKPETIDLLAYHDIGKDKHARIGSRYNPEGMKLSAPSQEETERHVRFLESRGFNVRIGG